ncbi:MAG: tRNA (adenosine(37)-N6)-threonylcarbamoyltransferase complex ATPase subunit type 1 TsaE [Chlorobi bacterium]|nr:tRNA (adenosine(37)-N6)-threonylcarbamoyltransferase complex ATPase subunit type 1 TsaE [Chlorobiota bacterium]
MNKFISSNIEETKKIAKKFANNLNPNDVVLLCGNLGTGKTAFTTGLVEHFGINGRNVSSPTFTLMNIYKGKLNIYHIDLYRLSENGDIFYDEVEEVVNSNGITVIEWGEDFIGTVKEIAEGNIYKVNLIRLSDSKREILIEKNIDN